MFTDMYPYCTGLDQPEHLGSILRQNIPASEVISHSVGEMRHISPLRSALGLCLSHPKHDITHDSELLINKGCNEIQRAISLVITVT